MAFTGEKKYRVPLQFMGYQKQVNREFAAVVGPKFSYSHAIYNSGTGPKLHEVVSVVRTTRSKSGGSYGPELVILRCPDSKLTLKPVVASALQGAKVLAKAKK